MKKKLGSFSAFLAAFLVIFLLHSCQESGSDASEKGTYRHYIGEAFGGGVIFHLWKDSAGTEHGLIVDIKDLSKAHVWSNVKKVAVGKTAQSEWDGMSNSKAIVSQPGHTQSAAALCLNSLNGGNKDWYLPALEEMEVLYQNLFQVNRTLRSISGASEVARWTKSSRGWNSIQYWCSTEYDRYLAWPYILNCGAVYSNYVKGNKYYVRAIRAF